MPYNQFHINMAFGRITAQHSDRPYRVFKWEWMYGTHGDCLRLLQVYSGILSVESINYGQLSTRTTTYVDFRGPKSTYKKVKEEVPKGCRLHHPYHRSSLSLSLFHISVVTETLENWQSNRVHRVRSASINTEGTLLRTTRFTYSPNLDQDGVTCCKLSFHAEQHSQHLPRLRINTTVLYIE